MDTLQNKTVRLSAEQVKGLKERAEQVSRETGTRIGWTAVVRVAVDQMLGRKRAKR